MSEGTKVTVFAGPKILQDQIDKLSDAFVKGAQLKSVQGGTTAEPTILIAPEDPGFKWAKASPGEYKFGSEPIMVATIGSEWIIEWVGGVPSLMNMGPLPATAVSDSLSSITGTTALSDKQGVILKELDSTNSSVVVDQIVFWSDWYWESLTDTSNVVLARREDIQQIRIGKYNTALSQWVTKELPAGTNVLNRANKRKYITNSNGTLTEQFDNLKFFSLDALRRFPVLSTLKKVNIIRKSNNEIKDISFVYFSVSETNLQIIINLNDTMSGSNPVQTFVEDVVLSEVADKSNAVIVFENGDIRMEMTFDFSNVSSFSSFNAQTFSKSLWGRMANDVVNSQQLPSKFLKSTESFSPFFVNNKFSGVFNKDYAQFFRDIMIIYPYDLNTYKYFFRIIRKNYLDDGESNKFQIIICRQPKLDSGIINIEQIASLTKGTIDSSGVELLSLTPYDASLKSKFYILVDWNNLPESFNGVMTADNNLISEISFNGGNGLIRSQIKLDTFEDLLSSRLDNVMLGAVVFKKSFFNADKIEDYMLSTDGAIPSTPKLSNLRYVNLGASIMFAGIDDDNRYWFINKDTNSIGYCNSLEDVQSLTISYIKTFARQPVVCRKLSNGEILVVTKGSFSESITAEIWVSANGQTTWTNKMGFDNANCETAVINQWGCSISGDRIVLAGYGKRYTGDEATTEAVRYTDLNDKANYSIYYSFDGGNTWHNRLFNLGSYFTNDFKPYVHIHAVTYDPYWGEIMVTHGDLDPTLSGNNRTFRTTNLREWEIGQKNGNPVSLKWTNEVTFKFGGVGAMQHTMLFGSDDLPNGIYRASKLDKSKCKVELAFTEESWKLQKAARLPNGNPDPASDYGIYAGYTFHRRNNNQPMYSINLYNGGTHAEDYKRNQIVATYDGYKYFKVWENDRDLVTNMGALLVNPQIYVDSDDYNNVLIQTRDSRFNSLIGGKPKDTNDYTLIICRGI